MPAFAFTRCRGAVHVFPYHFHIQLLVSKQRKHIVHRRTSQGGGIAGRVYHDCPAGFTVRSV